MDVPNLSFCAGKDGRCEYPAEVRVDGRFYCAACGARSSSSSDKPVAGADVARRLAGLYAAAGVPCEIEAGPVGLVVYAASQTAAARVANDLLTAVRDRDPRATRELVVCDRDEPPATSYVCTIRFDWRRF